MTLTKDLVSGIIFAVVGLVVVAEAMTHPLGSLLRMGPGYFPTVIGGLTILFGIALIGKSLLEGGPKVSRLALRELALLIGSIVIFAYALDTLGLVISIFLVVFISRLAARPVRWIETAVLALALALLGTAIFWWFLQLPVELWP